MGRRRGWGGTKIYAFVACVFLLSSPALASSDCFSFAALAFGNGETMDAETVVSTYVRLLKEVGGAELTPEVVAKIHAGGDPLTLPKDVHLTSGLDRMLAEFKRLIDIHFSSGFPYRAELPVGQIQKLRLSPDGTKIIGHQDLKGLNGSNAVVYQVDVAAVMARISER